MKILGLTGSAISYFCVATMLTQLAGIVMLKTTGRLDRDRIRRALALAYGVEKIAQGEASSPAEPSEDPSYDELAAARWGLTLDLDLRETALEKALIEYARQTEETGRDRARYDRVKADFDRARAMQLGLASNPQLQEVRRTLEAIKPAQAKEELRKMIADGSQREVVTIFKSMPTSKRKKIVAEFKADREAEELEAVIKEIRLGEPEVDLIRQTRTELQTLGARASR